MDSMRKESLTGFRNPTMSEKEEICQYVEKECGHNARINTFWRIFLEIISVACIISFFSYLYQGGKTARQAFFELVLGILLGCITLMMKKGNRRQRKFMAAMRKGDFQVIDCYSTKLKIDHGYNGSATVGIIYLETAQGQICSDKFIIANKDAYANENKDRIPLLLIVQKEYNYYEVLVKK